MEGAANMSVTPSVQSTAAQALLHSPIPALRKLHVEEKDGEVVLTGSVSSYYLKQLAQETVMPVLDNRELVNQVVVVRSEVEDDE
jgi:hypothetical protein